MVSLIINASSRKMTDIESVYKIYTWCYLLPFQVFNIFRYIWGWGFSPVISFQSGMLALWGIEFSYPNMVLALFVEPSVMDSFYQCMAVFHCVVQLMCVDLAFFLYKHSIFLQTSNTALFMNVKLSAITLYALLDFLSTLLFPCANTISWNNIEPSKMD